MPSWVLYLATVLRAILIPCSSNLCTISLSVIGRASLVTISFITSLIDREAEKKSLTRMYSDGWVLGGKTYPGSVTPKSFSPGGVPVIVITACMDISETTVHDSNGKSLVGSDRPPFQPLDLSFVTNSGSPTGLLISSITGSNQRCGD